MAETAEWRFLDSGKESAAVHMAVDEALVRAVEAGVSPPAFRLFEWNGPAVTVGHSQRVGEVLDLARCARDGVAVARRPTGGRACYHEHDLAFSIAGLTAGRAAGETLRLAGTVLAEALRSFGIESSFGGGGRRRSDGFGVGQAPCLLAATGHELVWHKRKLAGIAQRRFTGAYLIQGILLIAPGFERIADYLKGGFAGVEGVEAIEELAIDLTAVLGGPVDCARLKQALRESFEHIFGCVLSAGAITDGERAAARRIADERRGTVERGVHHET